MENIENIDQIKVFDLVMLAGKILLENGAEIFRVEETMKRIAQTFEVEEPDVFVMANGIFMTMSIKGMETRAARTMHIPLSPIHLGRVTAVNNLSRRIVEKKLTLDGAMKEMKEIENMPYESNKLRWIFAGVGSAAFCYMLGGTFYDSAVAFIAGFLLYIFIIIMQKAGTPEMLRIAFGSAFVTIVSICLFVLSMGDDINHIMIGSIISMVPGVSFTTAVRNFFSGDYLSGTTRLVNALLVSLCIAVGVGIVMLAWQKMM